MDIQMHAVNIEYVESVREILQDALQFKQSLGDGTWGAEPYTIQEVQQLLKRGEVYIFTNNKEAVATVSLEWTGERMWGSALGNDQDAVYVHKLAVLANYRGHGIGTSVIHLVGKKALQNERTFVRLDCGRSNKGLRSYYESLGFKLKGYHDKYYDSVLYEKQLT